MSQSDLREDNKKTAKTAIYNVVANVAALLVGIFIMPVLSRVLSQEDIGIASTFVANRNIIVIVATLAIYAFVNRAMIEFSGSKTSYIFSISVYCVLAVISLFIVLLPFKSYIQQLLDIDGFLYYWMFLSILSFALFSIADYYCIFQNFTKLVFAITLLTGPISQIISVLFSYFLPSDKYIGRVVGLDALYVIVSVVLIFWLIANVKKLKFRGSYIVTSLKFTIPIIPHLLSQMVLTQCDLIMITSMVGATESGIYSMGHTIGYLAFTVMTQVMAVWSPWVYRRLEEEDFSTIRSSFKVVMVIGFYLSVGLLTISPEMVALLLPDNYYVTNYVIPPLVASMFFQFCYLFFYDVEYFSKKSIRIAVASVIAAILNLILNFVFIPVFGFYAACYTTLTSYVALFFINYAFSISLDVRKVYNVKFIFTLIFLLLLYMVICVRCIDIAVIRYAFLLALTAILVIYKGRDIRGLLFVLIKGK